MQPGTNPPPAMQDSVVGRDMHTGNVIHNHYHAAPQPQAAVNPPPQPIIIQQVVAPRFPPTPIYVNYKKYHSGEWIFFGYAALILNLFSAGYCFGFNFCISLVGIVSLIPARNLGFKQPGHPETNKVGHAVIINVVSIGVGLLAVALIGVFSY